MLFARLNFLTGLFCATRLLPCMVLLLLFSACVDSNYTPASDSNGRRYSADSLAKDWRSNKASQPSYPAYPADNDSEYYYPNYRPPVYNDPAVPVYTPPHVYTPPPVYVPQQKQPQPYVYPHDNDEGYGSRYPKYDPDVDNGSGYYPYDGGKMLPKDKRNDGFTYPIYLD